MSALTVRTATTTVVNYAKRTPEQTLKVARAYAFLSANGSSIRDLVALTADQAAPLGRNRIALLIRAVKDLPADATVDAFTDALKAATDANRGKATPAATGEGSEPADGKGKRAPRVPQGDTTKVADLTVEQAIALLAELVTAHGNDATFQAALIAAGDFYRPVTLTSKRVRQAA